MGGWPKRRRYWRLNCAALSYPTSNFMKAVELSDGKYAEPLYLLADLYNGERT
jgi:hypothetical protein